ncbi:MAG: hypothetical protein QM817_36655 [Archangium sp.]
MTDEVDITAPNLPKVAGADDKPEVTDTSAPIRAKIPQASTTADGGPSEPSLGKVAVTADLLEPVAEPATTLDLDEEAKSLAKEAAPKKIELEAAAPTPAQTKQRRAVPRALGGDGFEGASVQQLPPVSPTAMSMVDLKVLARKSVWWLVGLFVFSVLVAFAVWMFD